MLASSGALWVVFPPPRLLSNFSAARGSVRCNPSRWKPPLRRALLRGYLPLLGDVVGFRIYNGFNVNPCFFSFFLFHTHPPPTFSTPPPPYPQPANNIFPGQMKEISSTRGGCAFSGRLMVWAARTRGPRGMDSLCAVGGGGGGGRACRGSVAWPTWNKRVNPPPARFLPRGGASSGL